MHPLDAPKLRRIAERLFEISDGRLATGAGLAPMLGELMMCVPDDCARMVTRKPCLIACSPGATTG